MQDRKRLIEQYDSLFVKLQRLMQEKERIDSQIVLTHSEKEAVRSRLIGGEDAPQEEKKSKTETMMPPLLPAPKPRPSTEPVLNANLVAAASEMSKTYATAPIKAALKANSNNTVSIADVETLAVLQDVKVDQESFAQFVKANRLPILSVFLNQKKNPIRKSPPKQEDPKKLYAVQMYGVMFTGASLDTEDENVRFQDPGDCKAIQQQLEVGARLWVASTKIAKSTSDHVKAILDEIK